MREMGNMVVNTEKAKKSKRQSYRCDVKKREN